MAEVILFHHVAGLTEGVRSFADRLRAGGHTVHTPDLFDGETAATIDEGLALVDRIGDEELRSRGQAALAALPVELVYGGFSYGSGMAQRFAQTRPGARGALLYEGCLPLTGDWGVGPWPQGLRAQVHGMDADPFFALEGDLDSAWEIAAVAGPGVVEVFTYPGDKHLFTDSSLPAYDKDATALVIERSVAFLDGLG
ncbi:MAG TPA: dienelactone hydrolase family protein [Trebonia sp.]|nr:dienelactone hydrolase family protein [Trebonia sp.]